MVITHANLPEVVFGLKLQEICGIGKQLSANLRPSRAKRWLELWEHQWECGGRSPQAARFCGIGADRIRESSIAAQPACGGSTESVTGKEEPDAAHSIVRTLGN